MNFLSEKIKGPMLGFGCEQLGGFQWGPVDIAEVENTIHEALESGITFFDTADIYALGQSEERLGKALLKKRNRAIICTKFGVRFENGQRFNDSSLQWLEKALENSLKRLKTDYIDLYLLHCPDGVTPWGEICEALEHKVAQGKILAYGFSNLDKDFPLSVSRNCINYQTEFSLINRTFESNIAKSIELDLIPTFYGCLGQGLLSGKYSSVDGLAEDDRRRHPRYQNFHGEKFRKNLELVEELKKIAQDKNVSPSVVALRWIWQKWNKGITLTGLKNRSQLSDILKVWDVHLISSEMQHLSAASLS